MALDAVRGPRQAKPSLLTRLRWRVEDFWDGQDARVALGMLVLAVLVVGGFLAARTVAHASADTTTRPKLHVVTLRQRVRMRVHGHVVTRVRLRKVYEKGQTVMQTETIHTPHGIRVVTHPVTRYHVVYRKHVVKKNGKTRTVLQPVTTSQTRTSTQLVTVTRQVTNDQTITVTQPVTTTVVSTETDTVPVTTTVTLPGTTSLP